ncbi:arylsulfatase A-like enzyme [Mariniflexile fucanivorans]|uniref:Arylsulfatase A-like enzyme n=1 Tax=Mariniflexile fucanivorans TaxID=264023 RepID=A0A4R1RLQ1_9FLAO|nr:sulfatase [Mariniflexile fucanivorans]TCL66810.1 arylsulfatase A-like enzyme [Mariniflexile fucanivorans]
MPSLIKTIGLFGFSLFSVFGCKSQQIKENRPNIVFIMADDLGWQDVGFMGSNWFETKNLDKLAEESLVFTNAYMYPTCSPSRAALMTGKQSFRTDVYTVPVLEKGDSKHNIFSRWSVGLEHTMYAEPLKKAGYKSIHIGKWHLVGPHPKQEVNYPFEKPLKQPANGNLDWLEHHLTPEIQKYYPIAKGFDENVGGTWWGDPARGYKEGYNSESGGYKAPFKNPFIEDKEGDEWLTDRLTDEAIDFINRNKNDPFFVNLHYYAPHRPTVPRNEEWFQKFMKKTPDSVTGQGADNLEEIAGYATMIASIDENVKRIFDYLDKEGLRENTIIIFTSDNGFNGLTSNTNTLRGEKGTVYEGGIRVPAFVNWKGKITAGNSETPICGMDYFPTFLELAQINDYKGKLDGESLVPLLENKTFKERALFWHVASTYKNPPCSIIRKGEWKLIQFLNDGKIELYNLEKDLKEAYNVADENSEITSKLLDELVTWRKNNKVPLPKASVLSF